MSQAVIYKYGVYIYIYIRIYTVYIYFFVFPATDKMFLGCFCVVLHENRQAKGKGGGARLGWAQRALKINGVYQTIKGETIVTLLLTPPACWNVSGWKNLHVRNTHAHARWYNPLFFFENKK